GASSLLVLKISLRRGSRLRRRYRARGVHEDNRRSLARRRHRPLVPGARGTRSAARGTQAPPAEEGRPRAGARGRASGMPLEPADDRLEAHHAPVGPARAGELVALAGEAEQLDLRLAQALERGVELLRLLDGAAPVLLAVHEEQRRAHVRGVAQGALPPQR